MRGAARTFLRSAPSNTLGAITSLSSVRFGAERRIHVRLSIEFASLVGRQMTQAEPYQKWSFTINRVPVRVSLRQIRGRRILVGLLRAATTFFS